MASHDRELLIAVAKLGIRAGEEVKELQASKFRIVLTLGWKKSFVISCCNPALYN